MRPFCQSAKQAEMKVVPLQGFKNGTLSGPFSAIDSCHSLKAFELSRANAIDNRSVKTAILPSYCRHGSCFLPHYLRV